MTDRNSYDKQTDDKQIKVTDKRMFTADGELREEYKDVGKGPGKTEGPTQAAASPEPTSSELTSAAAPTAAPQTVSPKAAPPRTAPPQTAGSTATTPPAAASSPAPGRQPEPQEYPSGAQFEDLVALLAQTTVTFLQQASSPRARTESLEQAQLYLDLLGILDDKTRGNLASGEQAMLEDALRQLRLAFAQRG